MGLTRPYSKVSRGWGEGWVGRWLGMRGFEVEEGCFVETLFLTRQEEGIPLLILVI